MLLLALMTPWGAWAQTTYTAGVIGTGTDFTYYPLPGVYGYQYDVYLYDADLINASGDIKSIAWYVTHQTSSDQLTCGFTVWMKDVDPSFTLSSSATFSDFISGATQVYSTTNYTSSDVTTSAWNKFTLSSSFHHTQGKSLLVCVKGNCSRSSGGCQKAVQYTEASNKHWAKHQDGTDPGNDVTGDVDGYRSNIKLNIGGQSITTSSAVLYDSGGSNGDYDFNEDYCYTFYPATAGTVVAIDLTSFASEEHFDHLYIYDGTTTNAPKLIEYSGPSLPDTRHFVATNSSGALTVWWRSDSGTNAAGFAITISNAITYTITANAWPSEGGTVSGAGSYASSSRTITASANSGYQFVNWTDASGDVVSSSASYTFNRGDVTYQANFTKTTITALPWTEDFESYTYSGQGLLNGDWATPLRVGSCPNVENYSYGAPSGNYSLHMGKTIVNYSMAVFPQFYAPLNTLLVEFKCASGYPTGEGMLGYVTDPSDGSTFVPLYSLSHPTAVPSYSSYSYDLSVNSNAPANANYRLAIRYKSHEQVWYFDDFSVKLSESAAATIPYTCDFEYNTTESWMWTFSNGDYPNKWCIGPAVNNGGSRSLYISNDNGTTNAYYSSESYVYAYRRINFATAGSYVISFDWRARGESSSYDHNDCYDAMFAALVPPGTACPPASNISGGHNVLPSGYINVADVSQSVSTTGVFLWTDDDSGWKSSSKAINLTTTGTYTLVFYWKNDNARGYNPPAAVDNISISVAPTYTLTVNTSPIACGTVTAGGSLQQGTPKSLTASANSGYAFDHWEVSGTGASLSSTTANPTTFTMGSENATVTACFTLDSGGESCEDFESVPGVPVEWPGSLPTGWNYIFTGNPDYRPKVYSGTDYKPGGELGTAIGSNRLMLIAGRDVDVGENAYVILPQISDVKSITFNAWKERYGTLYLGYITDVSDANTFTSLHELTTATFGPESGSANIDNASFSFDDLNIPPGARLAFRWNQSEDNPRYYAFIDNVCVTNAFFLNQDITELLECSGTSYKFYDSGGANDDYDSDQDYTATFISNADITITFNSFAVENYDLNYDYMILYDGETRIAKLGGSNGNINGEITTATSYTATSGTLKAVWHSDFSNNRAGWDATITTGACSYITEIASKTDWEKFCAAVNGGHDYSGETVTMTADVATAVTTMAGTQWHPFCGTFDGDGHTLTFNHGTAESAFNEQYCAPFRYVKDATIRDLKVAGDTYTSQKFAAGLVGRPSGTTSITDCAVSTVIHSSVNGDGTHGGFVAMPEGSLTIEGCAYTGRLLTNSGTNSCGGFVGWHNSKTINVTNSLYAPSDNIAEGWSSINHEATFVRGGNPTITNCYYTETMGTKQGKQAYAYTTVPANLGDLVQDYGMVKAYDNGILFDGTYYVHSSISLTVEGYGESTGHDYWAFIASPVAGSIEATAVNNLVAENANEFDLYRFNPSAELEWENWKQEDDDNYHNYHFNLVNGRGYLYATKETKTLVFSGPFNMDDEKTIEGLPEGFNLVGNPFIVDAYVNKPYYTLNGDGSAILSTASNAAIAPCHGVIVQVDGSESVTFSTTASTQQNAANNGSLQIALSQANTRGNAKIDNAIVSFGEGQLLGKFRFGRQNANIYIPQGGKDYAVAYSEGHGEMPLNFKANENGTYTLTVNPDGVEMDYLHLIDNMTGADVDLLAGASTGSATYTFTAKKTDYESRFKLVFVAKTASGDACEPGFAFINASGNLTLFGIEGKATLQVIDVTGHMLSSETTRRSSTSPRACMCSASSTERT